MKKINNKIILIFFLLFFAKKTIFASFFSFVQITPNLKISLRDYLAQDSTSSYSPFYLWNVFLPYPDRLNFSDFSPYTSLTLMPYNLPYLSIRPLGFLFNRYLFFPFDKPLKKLDETYTDIFYGEGDYNYSRFSVFQRVYLSQNRYFEFLIQNFLDNSQNIKSFNNHPVLTRHIHVQFNYHFLLRKKWKSEVSFQYFRYLDYFHNSILLTTTNRRLSFSRVISFKTGSEKLRYSLDLQNGINMIEENIYPSEFPKMTNDSLEFYFNQHYDYIKNSFHYKVPFFSLGIHYEHFINRKNVHFEQKDFGLFSFSLRKKIFSSDLRFKTTWKNHEAIITNFKIRKNILFHKLKMKFLFTYLHSRLPYQISFFVPDANKYDYTLYQFSTQGLIHVSRFLSSQLTLNLNYNEATKFVYPDQRILKFGEKLNFSYTWDLYLHSQYLQLDFGLFHIQKLNGSFSGIKSNLQIPITLFNRTQILSKATFYFYRDLPKGYYSFIFDYFYAYEKIKHVPYLQIYFYLPVKTSIFFAGFENVLNQQIYIINNDGFRGPQFRFGLIWRLFQ